MWSSLLTLFTSDSIYKYLCIGLGVALMVTDIFLEMDINSLEAKLSLSENEVKALTATVAQKRTEIELQNALIKQNEADYNASLEEAKKQSVVIKEKYKVIYKTIDNFKEDKNATDCVNLRNFGNSITW